MMKNTEQTEYKEREINVSMREESDFPDVNEQLAPEKGKGSLWGGITIAVVAILCFGGGIVVSRLDLRPEKGPAVVDPEPGDDDEIAPANTTRVSVEPSGKFDPVPPEPESPMPDLEPEPSPHAAERERISTEFYRRFNAMDYVEIQKEFPGTIPEIKDLSSKAKTLADDQEAILIWEQAIAAIDSAENAKWAAEAKIEEGKALTAEKRASFDRLVNGISTFDYEKYVPSEWKKVDASRLKAIAEGDSPKAAGLWEDATSALGSAMKAFALVEAKQSSAESAKRVYETKRDTINSSNWSMHGGDEWKEIQKMESQAAADISAARFDSAVQKYESATVLLGSAIQTVRSGIAAKEKKGKTLESKRIYAENIEKAENALKLEDFATMDAALQVARASRGWDDGGSYLQVLENRLVFEMQAYYLAREKYDEMVSGFDAALLEKFGEKDWIDAKKFAGDGHKYRYKKDMTKRYYEYACDKLRDLPYTLRVRSIEYYEKRQSWDEMNQQLEFAALTIDKGPNDEVLGHSTEETRSRALWLRAKTRKLPFDASIGVWLGDLGDDVFMDFKKVNSGRFKMGSKSFLGFTGNDDETPRHEVLISRSFWLSTTEISQEQYRQVMGTHKCGFEGDNLPVEMVTWENAMEFCRILTDLEHGSRRLSKDYHYTLPTEAQWEYACRAGTGGDFPGDLSKMGWYAENSTKTTHPVGTLEPNDWGFYDMHGNVWEWCRDFGGLYPKESVTDPEFTSENDKHLLRGGSWHDEENLCRSASRLSASLRTKNQAIGFRPVLVRVK